ncbi:MAG: hypothetical protein ABSA27_16900, partial [Terriglobales bacterium]
MKLSNRGKNVLPKWSVLLVLLIVTAFVWANSGPPKTSAPAKSAPAAHAAPQHAAPSHAAPAHTTGTASHGTGAATSHT